MKHLLRGLLTTTTFFVSVTVSAESLPCDSSDAQITSAVHATYEQYITSATSPDEPPKLPTELFAFSKELSGLIAADQKCSEDKGEVCAIDFDVLLSAQDWDGLWRPTEITVDKSTSPLIDVKVTFGSGKPTVTLDPVILKFKCEDAQLVIEDIQYKDLASLKQQLHSTPAE